MDFDLITHLLRDELELLELDLDLLLDFDLDLERDLDLLLDLLYERSRRLQKRQSVVKLLTCGTTRPSKVAYHKKVRKNSTTIWFLSNTKSNRKKLNTAI